MQSPRRETLAALDAARAGLAVAQHRRGADQIASKGGVDIVTGADVAAERAMRRILSDQCPELPIVGEEAGDLAPATGAYWLVDPICGTRNYASHLPLYCTNVALIESGVATIGVVGDGGTGELNYAERGRGAFSRQGGDDVALRARDGTVIGLEFGGQPPYRDVEIAKLFSGIAADGRFHPRSLGTTLDFVKIAAGDMAGMVMLWAPADPLHTAAGCLLAEEAGALVTDRHGRPWTLECQMLVAAATPELRDELLRYLNAS